MANWRERSCSSVPSGDLKNDASWGWEREEVRKVVFDNPYEFFDQSPNFDYER